MWLKWLSQRLFDRPPSQSKRHGSTTHSQPLAPLFYGESQSIEANHSGASFRCEQRNTSRSLGISHPQSVIVDTLKDAPLFKSHGLTIDSCGDSRFSITGLRKGISPSNIPRLIIANVVDPVDRPISFALSAHWLRPDILQEMFKRLIPTRTYFHIFVSFTLRSATSSHFDPCFVFDRFASVRRVSMGSHSDSHGNTKSFPYQLDSAAAL